MLTRYSSCQFALDLHVHAKLVTVELRIILHECPLTDGHGNRGGVCQKGTGGDDPCTAASLPEEDLLPLPDLARVLANKPRYLNESAESSLDVEKIWICLKDPGIPSRGCKISLLAFHVRLVDVEQGFKIFRQLVRIRQFIHEIQLVSHRCTFVLRAQSGWRP